MCFFAGEPVLTPVNQSCSRGTFSDVQPCRGRSDLPLLAGFCLPRPAETGQDLSFSCDYESGDD